MKTLATVIALVLCSCAAEYTSPNTGIKYSVQVPLSAIEKYLKIEPAK